MSTTDARSSAWAELLRIGVPADLDSTFADDPDRAARFTMTAGDLLVDLSKNNWSDEVRRELLSLAAACDVAGGWAAMRSGEPINLSEDRSVGHTWLRAPRGESVVVDGVDVVSKVNDALDRMLAFVDDVHAGRILGAGGRPFTDIVNVGIGGSDLGPRLAYEALRSRRMPGVRCHFVSNVDPANAADVLAGLDPQHTLVVVASKTFTTEETMANARLIRDWLATATDPSGHMCAVTVDVSAARNFGIRDELVFPFWNWVGGRYSLASSIGLPVALAVGSAAFRELLAGMRLIDEHVDRSSPADNVPLAMALVGAWNARVVGTTSKAVVPYAHDLRSLPAYLQQLDMESNGKSVHRDGSPVDGMTAPIVWGSPGTDAQHAYFQLLHQGTQKVAVDFIGFASPNDGSAEQHDTLLANLLAQSRALAFGRPDAQTHRLTAAEHRRFGGNRPNTVVLAPRLTPSTLGQIVALYEHVVFFQGWLWDINSFDQFGVELGKEMAATVRRELSSGSDGATDSSTRGLAQWILRHRGPAK